VIEASSATCSRSQLSREDACRRVLRKRRPWRRPSHLAIGTRTIRRDHTRDSVPVWDSDRTHCTGHHRAGTLSTREHRRARALAQRTCCTWVTHRCTKGGSVGLDQTSDMSGRFRTDGGRQGHLSAMSMDFEESGSSPNRSPAIGAADRTASYGSVQVLELVHDVHGATHGDTEGGRLSESLRGRWHAPSRSRHCSRSSKRAPRHRPHGCSRVLSCRSWSCAPDCIWRRGWWAGP
jgi:hypothetical protein